MKQSTNTLLEIQDLKKYFPVRKGLFRKTVGHIKAVDGVTFRINKGETIGLVGESGCGKSTTGRTILRLTPATSGSVVFKGQDILKMADSDFFKIRKEMQMIFQDPYSSLNPRMTVLETVGDPLEIHGLVKNREEKREVVENLLEKVGLRAEHSLRYPHEFSGGQRQRIGIARALTLNPSLIVADEPVSALDVSIQAQVINLLQDIQEEFGLTYVFIAHDLSVVQHISDRVAVMYLGRIVEIADNDDLYSNPLHPYTKALLSAVPNPDPFKKAKRIILEGDVPSPLNPPTGCPFHPRCPHRKKECSEIVPGLRDMGNNHSVSCHLLK